MSTFEAGVRARLTGAAAEFDRTAAARPTDEQLGQAYGKLGMIYHAQGLDEVAAAAYANAHSLVPRDKRWPYLLGLVYADSGKTSDAIGAFEAALALDPQDAVTQIALARLRLKQGEPDKARTLFEQAQGNDAARAAALAGLGKVALAENKYGEAVDKFEQALALAPRASRLRQPLALAYRALGNAGKAEENLKLYSVNGLEPGVPDPIGDQLNGNAAAYRTLLAKAQYAAKIGRPDLAEQAFRQALMDDPRNAEAMANLGVTLANEDRLNEAQQWLEKAVALDDNNAKTHLSLGLIFDRQGLDQLAVDQYLAASSRDPANLEAIVYRADAKMRLGLADEAAALYGDALAHSPGSERLQSSLAMALVKAGRFAEARKVLDAAVKAQPKNPDMTNLLARLLATAPSASVRDGRGALQMAKELYVVTDRSPIVGQTYAMALAETGNFEEAVRLQREVLKALGGAAASDAYLTRTLTLYQHRKPSREGWSPSDPLLQPRSPAARLATKTS